MKILLFVLGFLQVSLVVRKANGLFCYKCAWVKGNQNCNEEEPINCKNEEMCVTLSDEVLWKGCAKGCPKSSRGDETTSLSCEDCDTDLCNGNHKTPGYTGILRHGEATTPNGTKFVLYVKDSTFWEARLRCSMGGGILATIHSLETQRFLNENFLSSTSIGSLVEKSPPESSFRMDEGAAWLGLKLEGNNNSAWIWTDDGALLPTSLHSCEDNADQQQFENWLDGYPVNSPASCGYATRDSGGMWKSGSCGGILPSFLCEYPDVQRQSAVRKNQVLTFKASVNASVACNDDELELEIQKYGTMEMFKYFWKYRIEQSCLQSEAKEGKLARPECGGHLERFVLCERSLPAGSCKTVSSNGIATNSVAPASERNFCENYVQKRNGEKYTFKSTKSQRFSYSIEKCRDGRPKAMMFCKGLTPPVLDNFVKIDCDRNFTQSLSEVTKNGNLSVLLDKIQAFHEAVLLDKFSQNSLISMATSLVEEFSNVSVTDNGFAHIVAAVGEVRRTLTERWNGINESVDMKANLSYFPLALEMLAMRVGVKNENHSLSADGMDVEIVELDYNAISQGEEVGHISPDERSVIHIVPTVPLSRSIPSDNLRVVFTTYDDDDLFPTEENNIRVGSQVISATVSDGRNTYSVPVEFSMQVSANRNLAPNECEQRECRYYNHSEQMWKRNGCYRVKKDEETGRRNTVKCKCDHTTSFAVVVSQHVKASYALDLVSTIGLSICFVCLSMTVMIFLLTPELRKVRSAFTHMNLCICLAIAYLVFLVGVEATDDRYGCLSVAALTHFFLLASWGWMGVESLTMYRMFVRSFQKKVTAENGRVAAIVYTASAAIVLVTLSIAALAQYEGWEEDTGCEDDIWSSYIADGYCWLQGNSLYFGFLLIVGISLCFNIVLASIIIKAITWGRTTVQCSVEEKPILHVMRAVLVAMLLGLAWIFAVPLAISKSPIVQGVFGWLFALTTFIQGVFIFYFFCVRRKEVRDSWLSVIKKPFTHSFISRKEDSMTLAADGSGRSGSMYYLPNIGRTPASSTIGSEMTQRTTASRETSFVSSERQEKGKTMNGSNVNVVDHNTDTEVFRREEAFE